MKNFLLTLTFADKHTINLSFDTLEKATARIDRIAEWYDITNLISIQLILTDNLEKIK